MAAVRTPVFRRTGAECRQHALPMMAPCTGAIIFVASSRPS